VARRQAASDISEGVAASRLQIAPPRARPSRQPGCRVKVARLWPRAGYWKLVSPTGHAEYFALRGGEKFGFVTPALEMECRLRVVTALSLSRFLTSGAFVILSLQHNRWAHFSSMFCLFAIELSDFIDGKLARRWAVSSRLGYIADAVGDRAAYVAYALVCVVRAGLPPLLAYALIARDFGLFGARSYFSKWSSLVENDRVWTKLNGILARIILWCFLGLWYTDAMGWGLTPPAHRMSVVALTLVFSAYLSFSYFALCVLIRKYKSREALTIT